MELRDNSAAHRFELVDGAREVAIADYHIDGTSVVVTHVEVAPERREDDLGGVLVEAVYALVRGRGGSVRAACHFALEHLRLNPNLDLA